MTLSGRQRNDSLVGQWLSVPILLLFPYCFYINKIKISLNSETLLTGRKTLKDCISKVFEIKQQLIYRTVFNMQSVSKKIVRFRFSFFCRQNIVSKISIVHSKLLSLAKIKPLFYIFRFFSPKSNQRSNGVCLFQMQHIQDFDIAMRLSYQKSRVKFSFFNPIF